MKNLPANPLLHSLIFFMVATQSTVGIALYFGQTHQQHPLLLNLHLGLTVVAAALFLVWIWKLNLPAKLGELINANDCKFSSELHTFISHVKKRRNPGAQYPLLTIATQLLGLGALGLTLITAALYRAALTPLANQPATESIGAGELFWPYGIAMGLLAFFIVGHVAMAVLHKIEQ